MFEEQLVLVYVFYLGQYYRKRVGFGLEEVRFSKVRDRGFYGNLLDLLKEKV